MQSNAPSDVHFQEASPLPQEGARLEAGTQCEAILWIWAENDRAVMGETKAVGESMFTRAAEDGDAAQSEKRQKPTQVSSCSTRTRVGANLGGEIRIRPE